MLFDLLPRQWQEALPSSKHLLSKIELRNPHIPDQNRIFAAFEQPISEVKVCIVGQDPYPNPNHAMGLAFSVPSTVKKLPPTLKNIFKELEDDIGVVPSTGDLSVLQSRGVMLLNTSLTTIPYLSQGHAKIGWVDFTDQVVEHLSRMPVVFILWGKSAAELRRMIPGNNCIISAHPSPLSAYRGFFGSKPFTKANNRLIELGIKPVDWKI
ncbi:MAG: uracil-DNA glycosylase [Actinobacteria bacterium]|nr:uracil-DNA glycosylase [Actinomycetota bacterium]MDA2996609.1 uracil-DNA glycosylase [Actinomycetota bacterium]